WGLGLHGVPRSDVGFGWFKHHFEVLLVEPIAGGASLDVLDRLPEVAGFQFRTDSLAPKQHRDIDLGADASERGEHDLTGVAAQHDEALDYVQLQRVDVFLVLAVARLPIRQHAIKPDVIPHRIGVLSPDPMREAVFDLVAGPAAIPDHICGRHALAGILQHSNGVAHRYRVLSLAPEQQQVVP